MRDGEGMEFIAIDVETANPDLGSICQVGVAEFANGKCVQTWSSLVNPKDEFYFFNVSVHGITEDMVVGAPEWSDVYSRLKETCENQIVASHTPFDRTAIYRACEKHQQIPFECRWIDTARVVRRTWTEFSKSGYNLKNIASHLEIDFHHHDAGEDARATGEVLVKAIEESGTSVDEWCQKSLQAITSTKFYSELEVNIDGPLFGDEVVFTGALSIPRREAAQLAAAAGCKVGKGVTKRTTLLVVGDQDIRVLGGAERTAKHRKAEVLIEKGQPIRVVGESDFERLLSF